jgi:hypothetical protein
MAELVDAPASGAGTGNGVEVRVLFWAPILCSGTSRKIQKPRESGVFCWVLQVSCPAPSIAITDTRIRALQAIGKPTKHGDGGGLLLVVNPNGSKLRRMVYRYGASRSSWRLVPGRIFRSQGPCSSGCGEKAAGRRCRRSGNDDAGKIAMAATAKANQCSKPTLRFCPHLHSRQVGSARETNIEVDNDGGERIRGFTSQQGSGTSNSSILSIAHPSSSRHVLVRNDHRDEFRKSTEVLLHRQGAAIALKACV